MIDVIVLSKDRPDLFDRCLAGLAAQEVPYQGWLVDNGTDGTTADTAHRHGWQVITPGRNTGFSEGNNIALAASDADRVLLLNNDAVLHPGALAAMAGHEAGIVGALIVGTGGLVGHAGGVLQRGGPLHEGRGSAPGEWSCHPCSWVTFAAALLRRDMVRAVGPMDEGYWYSFEDVDYCLHASEAGWDVEVCADAVVTHDERTTRDGSEDQRNLRRFHQKWPHARRAA